MRIAEVIGKVTLSKCHESLRGSTWLVAVPLMQDELKKNKPGRTEPFVIFDERGANTGCRIAVSEGAEASAPFYPDSKPIDAYNTAILDVIDVR